MSEQLDPEAAIEVIAERMHGATHWMAYKDAPKGAREEARRRVRAVFAWLAENGWKVVRE